jgi:hypothetical protein
MAKRRLKKRRAGIYLVILILLLAGGPYLLHMGLLQAAFRQNDVMKLAAECDWLQAHGGHWERLGLIQDAELVLALNQGRLAEAEGRLSGKEDDTHRFWLVLLRLRQDDLSSASQTAAQISAPVLRQLADGLLELARGEDQSAFNEILAIPDQDLSKSQRTVKYVSLSRLAMAAADLTAAAAYAELAQNNQPRNPVQLWLGFDVALAQGRWQDAWQLSLAMEEQTWRPLSREDLAKKALLLLCLEREGELAPILRELAAVDGGEGLYAYVTAVQALRGGDWQAAQSGLAAAANAQNDAELDSQIRALGDFVASRIEAEQRLQRLMAGTGE